MRERERDHMLGRVGHANFTHNTTYIQLKDEVKTVQWKKKGMSEVRPSIIFHFAQRESIFSFLFSPCIIMLMPFHPYFKLLNFEKGRLFKIYKFLHNERLSQQTRKTVRYSNKE
jgi:hypothetical protein